MHTLSYGWEAHTMSTEGRRCEYSNPKEKTKKKNLIEKCVGQITKPLLPSGALHDHRLT